MPESIPIASFVLGAVLLLIFLVGGDFTIFGSGVKRKASLLPRIIAGLLGIFFIFIGLVYPVVTNKENNKDTELVIPDSSGSETVESEFKVSDVPESLTGTWVGNLALLEDQQNPMLVMRLVVNSKKELNLYKSYLKEASYEDAPPIIISKGWLSKEKGLHLVCTFSSGVVGIIDSRNIEYLGENSIYIEGVNSVDSKEKNVLPSERRLKFKVIIKLERES